MQLLKKKVKTWMSTYIPLLYIYVIIHSSSNLDSGFADIR